MLRPTLILLALVSEIAANEQVAISQGSVRGLKFEKSEQSHRQLWGSSKWSFNSLLFHLHICKISPDCPDHVSKGPLDCKCPDCTVEHLHPDAQTYCENLALSSTTSAEASEGSSEGSDGSNSESGSNAKSASGGDTQNASRTFSPLLAVIAAATVFALVGALIMRKRRNTEEAKDLTAGSNAAVNDGLSTYFGAVMGKMGLGSDKSTVADSEEDLVGSVSRRMELLKEGGPVPPINERGSGPAFIEINTFDGIQTTISEGDHGIEIEGPTRPSSYAI